MLACFAISVNAQQVSGTGYYYDDFEYSSQSAFKTNWPNYTSSPATPATIAWSQSSPLDGSNSLASVSNTTSPNSISNVLTASTSLNGNNAQNNAIYWEWSVQYKFNSTANISDVTATTISSSTKNAWKFWLTADSKNPATCRGYYITQKGSAIVLVEKNNTDQNGTAPGPMYNTILTSGNLTQGVSYNIKVQRINTGSQIFWRMYIDGNSLSATTLNPNQTAQDPNNSNIYYTGYAASILESVTNDNTTANYFQWDDIKMYQRSIMAVSNNNAASGVSQSPNLYLNETGVVLFSIGIADRGVINIQNLTLSVSPGNPNARFTNTKLVKSIDPYYSTTGDNSTIATNFAIDPTVSIAITDEAAGSPSAANGSQPTVFYYFLVADVSSSTNTYNPNSFKFSFKSLSTADQNYGVLDNTSTITDGQSYSVGTLYDWIGATNTSWNFAGNWFNNTTNAISSTVPTGTDVARIGVIAYQGQAVQPTVNVASSLGQLIVGSRNTPTITLTSGLTINNGLTINASSPLIISSGSFTLNGASSMGTGSSFTLNNSSAVTLGSSATFSNPGTVAVNGNSSFTIPNSSAFTNNGSFTLSAGTLNVTSSASFSNSATGTLTAGNSSVINCTASIFNTGGGVITIGSTGSPASLSMGASGYFPNSGTVIVGPTSCISFTAGTSSIANSNSFTLQSDATGSASITAMPTGASIQGIINVQRYISGNSSLAYRGYRLLSSPVNVTSYISSTTGSNYISLKNLSASSIVNGITNYGVSTGGVGGTNNGFTISNNNPTIYFYNEPTLVSGNNTFLAGKNVGVSNIGNPAITLTSTQYGTHTVNMPVGNGFILFYIGNTHDNPSGALTATSNSTITYPGYINQQNVPVYLWYTPNAGSVAGTAGNLSVTTGAAGSGYNMLGNPYASIIDLNKVYSDNSDTSKYTTFYELTAPGQNYVSYNASSGAKSSTTYSSQYIASGQGFVVQARKPGLSLTFKEDQKVPYSATPVLSGTTSPPILLSLRKGITTTGNTRSDALMEPANGLEGLHLKMSIDTATFTECGIYFSKQWSDGYDANDAIDIGGVSPKMSLSSLCTDGYKLGINSLGDYTKGKRIKIYVAAAASGNYNLGLGDIQNIDTALFHLYLVDNLKKDSVDLISSKGYAFTVTNGDTTTYGSNRFVLAVERKALPPYQLLSFTAQKASNGVLLTWKTSNESTYTGFSIEKQDGSQYITLYNVQSNGGGVYTYTDTKPTSGTNTYKLGQNDIDSLETYSNPVSVVYSTTISSSLVSVYPNPAKEQITVSFSGATNSNASYTASIYNSTGLLIGQKSVSGDSWNQDVSTLRPGGYILEIRSGNGSLIGNTKFTKYQ